MITIGLYDRLSLRLDSYFNLLNSYENTEVIFKTSSLTQLINRLELSVPDVMILLSSKPDQNFKKVAISIKNIGLNTIAITTDVSKWLIPNMKCLNILGYVVMGTRASNLEDAIHCVSQGTAYCCNEVGSELLGMANNSTIEFSEREREIIKLLIDDKSSKEIASALCLSQHTISSHRKMILRKFDVHSTTGMVKKAIDAGLG